MDQRADERGFSAAIGGWVGVTDVTWVGWVLVDVASLLV